MIEPYEGSNPSPVCSADLECGFSSIESDIEASLNSLAKLNDALMSFEGVLVLVCWVYWVLGIRYGYMYMIHMYYMHVYILHRYTNTYVIYLHMAAAFLMPPRGALKIHRGPSIVFALFNGPGLASGVRHNFRPN